jgi:hypothetical protein
MQSYLYYEEGKKRRIKTSLSFAGANAQESSKHKTRKKVENNLQRKSEQTSKQAKKRTRKKLDENTR